VEDVHALRLRLHKTVTQLEVSLHYPFKNWWTWTDHCSPWCSAGIQKDARIFWVGRTSKIIRRIEEAGETGIYLTNYETVRDGKLDPRLIPGSIPGRSSVLRGFGGTKTFREFMRLFTGDAGPLGNRRGTDVFLTGSWPLPHLRQMNILKYLPMLIFSAVMDVSARQRQGF
jgi:hypothetical protein